MPEEILLGIQTVADDKTFLCEEIDCLMSKRSLEQIWLTPRERALLRLIVMDIPIPRLRKRCFSRGNHQQLPQETPVQAQRPQYGGSWYV
jgi:hypothetical protein